MKLQVGDHVRVKGHWNFPADCTGIVGAPPKSAQDLVGDSEPWNGHFRTVKGVKGPVEFTWVNFDIPQRDGDGDGPYAGSEIETKYIKKYTNRLRTGDIRVFYDVAEATVEILAIVTKAEAQAWLDAGSSPARDRGAGGSQG